MVAYIKYHIGLLNQDPFGDWSDKAIMYIVNYRGLVFKFTLNYMFAFYGLIDNIVIVIIASPNIDTDNVYPAMLRLLVVLAVQADIAIFIFFTFYGSICKYYRC